jgi:hypothetical protein
MTQTVASSSIHNLKDLLLITYFNYSPVITFIQSSCIFRETTYLGIHTFNYLPILDYLLIAQRCNPPYLGDQVDWNALWLC